MSKFIEFNVSTPTSGLTLLEGPSTDSAARPSRKKRCGSTRVRTGCLTCRQRRKKCIDNTYPTCGNCRRLHLECIREATRILPISQSSYEESSPYISLATTLSPGKDVAIISTSSNNVTTEDTREIDEDVARIPDLSQLSIFSEMPGGTRDRRYFLRYYTEILAVQTAASHQNNSFISVFLPMAFESTSLLSAIVAWSSIHLARFQIDCHPKALQHTNLALREVARSLAKPNNDFHSRETDIASCIVLCSLEASAGSSQWYQHLIGARELILSTETHGSGGETIRGPEALQTTLEGQFLLRNFAYYDVLASVTSGEEPLIPGTYWIYDNVEVLDSNMGFGSRLLGFVSAISSLQIPGSSIEPEDDMDATSSIVPPQLRSLQNETDISNDNIWLQFHYIENQIQSWTLPQQVQPSLTALAEAWRNAALIYLYRKRMTLLRCQAAPPSHILDIESKISVWVENVLFHVSLIPIMSLAECSMLFPLFMAGGNTTNPAHIKTIRMRLWALLEGRGFGNLKQASGILEELWRLKSNGIKGDGNTMVDWTHIIKKSGMRFLPS